MSVYSLARPLWQGLGPRPFAGHVVGTFRRACTALDKSGRVVTLAAPALGPGPLTVLVSEPLLARIRRGDALALSRGSLRVAGCTLSLQGVALWQAELPVLRPATCHLPLPEGTQTGPRDSAIIIALLAHYATWPTLNGQPYAPAARRAALALTQALVRGDTETIAAAAGALAGLGRGLTPAGDDYLLGLLAMLWLCGRHEFLAPIARAAAPRTTALSAAYLRAGARGQFSQPWHPLAAAWQRQSAAASSAAMAALSRVGASSGGDALAGFAQAARVIAPQGIT